MMLTLTSRLTSLVPARWHWRVAPLVERLATRLTPPDIGYRTVRRDGLRWTLRPTDEVDRDLFWYGCKEPGDWAICRQFLRPGAVMLDVGANFGYYGLNFAHALHGHCVVHAFEPNPPTFQRLQNHIRWNHLDCVHAHPIGLGDDDAVFQIHSEDSNTGSAYLQPITDNSSANTIRVTTLDHFATQHSLDRVDFVKVDIEGHECYFLDGAKEVLGRFLPPMMIEVHPEALVRNGHTTADVFSRLRGIGYQTFAYRRTNQMVAFDDHAFDGGYKFHNVFCLRENAATFSHTITHQ